MCNLYLTLTQVLVCAAVRVYVGHACLCMCGFFFFLLLLMHQVVIPWHFLPCTQQSFKPCGSPLLLVFSLPSSVSWVWQVCRVETNTDFYCGCLNREFQILHFRTLVRNPDVRKSVVKMKWHSCTALSQIAHHEVEQSHSLVIFPMQGLLRGLCWMYRSDSTTEALLPNGGLSHGVLAQRNKIYCFITTKQIFLHFKYSPHLGRITNKKSPII